MVGLSGGAAFGFVHGHDYDYGYVNDYVHVHVHDYVHGHVHADPAGTQPWSWTQPLAGVPNSQSMR